MKTKHVEGVIIACLDEGSNPSGSTITHNYFVVENIINPTSLLDWVLLFLDTNFTKIGGCICRTGTTRDHSS